MDGGAGVGWGWREAAAARDPRSRVVVVVEVGRWEVGWMELAMLSRRAGVTRLFAWRRPDVRHLRGREEGPGRTAATRRLTVVGSGRAKPLALGRWVPARVSKGDVRTTRTGPGTGGAGPVDGGAGVGWGWTGRRAGVTRLFALRRPDVGHLRGREEGPGRTAATRRLTVVGSGRAKPLALGRWVPARVSKGDVRTTSLSLSLSLSPRVGVRARAGVNICLSVCALLRRARAPCMCASAHATPRHAFPCGRGLFLPLPIPRGSGGGSRCRQPRAAAARRPHIPFPASIPFSATRVAEIGAEKGPRTREPMSIPASGPVAALDHGGARRSVRLGVWAREGGGGGFQRRRHARRGRNGDAFHDARPGLD